MTMEAADLVAMLELAGYEPAPHPWRGGSCVAVPVEPRELYRIGADVTWAAIDVMVDRDGATARDALKAAQDVVETMEVALQGVDTNGDDILYWPGLAWPWPELVGKGGATWRSG